MIRSKHPTLSPIEEYRKEDQDLLENDVGHVPQVNNHNYLNHKDSSIISSRSEVKINNSKYLDNEEQLISPSLLTSLCHSYEKKMREFMSLAPNVPPTLYELGHKHVLIRNVVHNELAMQLCVMNMDDDIMDDIKYLRKRITKRVKQNEIKVKLDGALDEIFAQLAAENQEENRRSQLLFILGFKNN